MKEDIISFPHLGNYSGPISFFLRHLTHKKIRIAPPITKKTIELGSKYSPDFVCVPFKYNLGNFIEALENNATIIAQAGGGCRYGAYGEIQEAILKDLGYDFTFLSLMDNGKLNIKTIYKALKQINPKLKEFPQSKGYFSLTLKYFKYRHLFRKLKINKKKDCLKIGIIGELYTSMEQFSSYFIEEQLASYNIEVKRFTNLSYLLIKKHLIKKKLLKDVKSYVKYDLGADGLDNVARCQYLINKKYDGIIHIKPFGCTPEIGAIPIINRVCQEAKMPIIYFSFDAQTSDEGIKTRLEALVDMLKERKKVK